MGRYVASRPWHITLLPTYICSEHKSSPSQLVIRQGAQLLSNHRWPLPKAALSRYAPTAYYILSVSFNQALQFLHRPKSASIQIPPQFLSTTYESSSSSSPLPASAHRTFGFLACPEAPYSPPESTDGGQSHAADETVQIISDTFLASSENGFILSRPETGSDGEGEAAWNCSAPGGLATIEWDASS